MDADAVATQQLGRDPGEHFLDAASRAGAKDSDDSASIPSDGRGSAERSTLPLGESGNDATMTNHDGTIASGRRSRSHRRSSAAAMAIRRGGYNVGGEPLLAP